MAVMICVQQVCCGSLFERDRTRLAASAHQGQETVSNAVDQFFSIPKTLLCDGL